MIELLLSKIGYTKTINFTKIQVKIEKQRVELIERAKLLQAEKNNSNKLDNFKLKYITTANELNELKTKNKLPTKNQLQNWSKNVRKTGKCDCCGEKEKPENLTAHHLWTKDLHPSLANRTANGVALCTNCHNGYHKKYPCNENCNPSTYQEYKTDEYNKKRVLELENENKKLRKTSRFERFKQALS